jgi:hypothetical protein
MLTQEIIQVGDKLPGDMEIKELFLIFQDIWFYQMEPR